MLIFPPIYQINSRTLWSPSYKGFERSLLSYKGCKEEETILPHQIPQSSHQIINPFLPPWGIYTITTTNILLVAISVDGLLELLRRKGNTTRNKEYFQYIASKGNPQWCPSHFARGPYRRYYNCGLTSIN